MRNQPPYWKSLPGNVNKKFDKFAFMEKVGF